MYCRILLLLIISIFGITNIYAESLQDQIKGIGKTYCPDKRVAVWDINIHETSSGIEISGVTDNREALNALETYCKSQKGISKIDITLLPDTSLKGNWAFTIIPYAHLRTGCGHDKEMATQSLMGNPLKVLEKNDDWYRVQTPDNYIAWVVGNSIKIVNDDEFRQWQKANRFIVTDIYTYLYELPDTKSDVVSDILLGNILVGERYNKDYYKLSTPDGRIGYAKKESIQPIDNWAMQKFDADKIVDTAKRLMGSTYTWGGTSTKGVDCSGLTKTSYFSNAIILQRDASQQVLYGLKIAPKDWKQAKKGDLLYFGTKSGKVTHTAIYMSDGNYIHASGRVKVNSVDPEAKTYLSTPFLSINRINGYVDTKGIASVKNHPWYFNY